MKITSFESEGFIFRNYIDCDYEIQKIIIHFRNLPEIRKWMNNSDEISLESHLHFIENLRNCDNRFYFAILSKGNYIGSIYIIKVSDSCWERGLYMCPEKQSRGITVKIESAFLRRLYFSFGIRTIIAEVKKDNEKSNAYHNKAGYVLSNEDSKYNHYILKEDNMLHLFSMSGGNSW